MPPAARRALLRWYRAAGRHHLPWRHTRDPWQVLLAELMLQRTRADLVAPVYLKATARWPTADSLAGADPTDVRNVLAPLGLAHRVGRLIGAARTCRDGVPRTQGGLLRVPGVGRYAATATLCFAFGRRVAIVDPSIIRVLERYFGLTPSRSRAREDPQYWEAAAALLPSRMPREWNFALLDLGSLVCRATPHCSECPLSSSCPTGAFRLGH